MSVNPDKNLIMSALESSCRLLEENRERLDRMNYFPVADKDTGTNMATSVRKALDCLKAEERSLSSANIFGYFYDSLLETSRGNSGTILAMFAEGFSLRIPEDGIIDGKVLAEAFDSAAKNACNAVLEVKDGTMLTVSLDAARAGLSAAEMTDDAAYVWRRICEEAHAALTMTAFRNPVLRRFGVADAGAFGMCLILDGLLTALCPGEELPAYTFCEEPSSAEDGNMPVLIYPYCTELVIQKKAGADAQTLKALLTGLGDCLHCIENTEKIKLHIHTADPLKVIDTSSFFGEITSEKIENMADPCEIFVH